MTTLHFRGHGMLLLSDDNTARWLSCSSKPPQGRLSYVVMMPRRRTGYGPGP